MKSTWLLVIVSAAVACAYGISQGNDRAAAPLQVPAKSLAVPTDVSPEMQRDYRGSAQAGLGCFVEDR